MPCALDPIIGQTSLALFWATVPLASRPSPEQALQSQPGLATEVVNHLPPPLCLALFVGGGPQSLVGLGDPGGCRTPRN